MKIDFDAPLTDLDGNPAQENGQPILLKTICVNALLMENPNEPQTGEEKYNRYRLAGIVHTGGEADVKAEDIALIKKLVAAAYPPLVVGRVFDLLEA